MILRWKQPVCVLLLLIIVLSVPAIARQAAPNTLTEKEKKGGWTLLFDGKSMKGSRGAYMEALPKKGWEVKDGMLIVQESGGGEASFGATPVGKKIRENVESETERLFFAPWSCLNETELGDLQNLAKQLHDGLQNPI